MSGIEREAKAEAERFFGPARKLWEMVLLPSMKVIWANGYVAAATFAAPRAVDRVRRAWTVAGPAPRSHELMRRRLRREWPALAGALDELTAPDERSAS